MKTNSWVILKFGGSSVAEPAHWQTISRRVQSVIDEGCRPCLVLSALKNVSNQLEELLHQANNGCHLEAIHQLQKHHLSFAEKLGLSIETELQQSFTKLVEICNLINQNQTITPALHAEVLSFGELLSTQIGTHYLNNNGIVAIWKNAGEMLESHQLEDEWHHFTSATCAFKFDPQLSDILNQSTGVIVTQGFVARDKKKNTVLLGREGSDTSAAYLGAKLAAKRIEIWTDVAGVFTANPKELKQAIPMANLSYQQADAMAKLGAKVLHPRAIEPAKTYKIPVLVKSTWLPDEAGTCISEAKPSTPINQQILSLAIEPEISLLKVPNEIEFMPTQVILASGFDEITRFQTPEKHFIVFSYANSDQPQPKDRTMQHEIVKSVENKTDKADIQFESKLAIISLVGNQLDSILPDVENFVAKSIFESEIHFNYQEKTIHLLVERRQVIEIASTLHEHFILK